MWVKVAAACALFVIANAGIVRYLEDVGDAIVPDFVPNPLSVVFTNSCIEDLGCFYTGPPFYSPLGRPIPLPPTDRETIYSLYTPDNPSQEYRLKLDEESVVASPYKSSWPTKILIHGFRSDLDVNDIRHALKDRLLNQSDYNVIIIDWTSQNGFPYAQAVANTRIVGAKVAKLITLLIVRIRLKESEAKDFHIIGHSLGAHTAGYAGERIKGLGRISGLDPAGTYFRDTDPKVRLDTTDAIFVDIIHSDGGEIVVTGLGINQPIGHVDFYPNGGRWQPGCSHTTEQDNLIGQTINVTQMYLVSGCDHGMGTEYYLESILNDEGCRFLAVQCSSYQDFENGACPPHNSTVRQMGYHAKPIPDLEEPAKFFLRTSAEDPYCIEDTREILNSKR